MHVVRLAFKNYTCISMGVPAFSEQQVGYYRKNYNITVGLKAAGFEVVMDNKGWKDIQKNIWTLPKIEERGIYLTLR